MGVADSHVAGRDNQGRIVSAVSGIARTPDVKQAEPDVVIVLYGEEDFEDSVLVRAQRDARALNSRANILAASQRRAPGNQSVAPCLSPLTASLDGMLPKISPRIFPSIVEDSQSPGTFAGDFEAMLTDLLTVIASSQIYVMTPPFRPDAAAPNDAGFTLGDYRDALVEIAARHAIPVLDAFRDSTIQPSTFGRVSDDGVTLNAAGHEHLAGFLIDAMT